MHDVANGVAACSYKYEMQRKVMVVVAAVHHERCFDGLADLDTQRPFQSATAGTPIYNLRPFPKIIHR